MRAALEHLIYLWKECVSSFVPAGSLLMSAVARGRFAMLSSPRDAHSSQMESREGHGERPPFLQEQGWEQDLHHQVPGRMWPLVLWLVWWRGAEISETV